jgi:uncharacterized membrane protein YhaH (DUF805 family)
MYGMTRGPVTLIAAALAGLLVWIATQVGDSSNGEYWGTYGLIAGAGLIMALSQLIGGWTKWGVPRISIGVFLTALIPVAVVVLWIVIFHQPHHGLGRQHIRRWSNDIGIDGLVKDFKDYVGVLAFGLGLVVGFTFDTSGPVPRGPRTAAAPRTAVPQRSAPPPARETAPRDAPPPE